MSVPTVRDVMRQIEFELAQGMVGRPDLRKTLRELRRFHEQTRAAVFGDDGERATVDLREAVSRQFQINDMLLAVLGEAADAAHEAHGEARRVRRYVAEALEGIDSGRDRQADGESARLGSGAEPIVDAAADDQDEARRALSRPGLDRISVLHGATDRSASKPVDTLDRDPWDPEIDALHLADELDSSADPEEEVEWAMRPERLWLGMDERAPRLPLMGSLLRRFRTALHTRVLIYAGQLGEKQSRVNRILGDHLLRLLQIARAQSATIDAMRLRLGRLEASERRAREDGDRSAP